MLFTNSLTADRCFLWVLGDHPLSAVRQSVPTFFGKIIAVPDVPPLQLIDPSCLHYVCGDLVLASNSTYMRALVVKELTTSPLPADAKVVSVKQLPCSVHGLGVFVENFFDESVPYFANITTEHAFQSLTESNKPSTAFRKGIYITNVLGGMFHLLRCSTNLDGPTDNVRQTDKSIIAAANQLASVLFAQPVTLNHVLAQVYWNHTDQTKAKIKAHSDKTKDMPTNGIMAFCTFYDKPPSGVDALTRLVFKRKADAPDTLPDAFTILLHDTSMFLMPLSTNVFYTHEIRSSPLPASALPTRLGYVIRCSNIQAMHHEGQTYVWNEKWTKLEPPTEQGIAELKEKYYRENQFAQDVSYGFVPFSLNSGDYKAPLAT